MCPLRRLFFILGLLLLPFGLNGCETFGTSPQADHRIKLVEQNGKTAAVPPECVSWKEG
jgi:hypothetical protein